MKEVELKCFCCDANEIESGVEVDDNDAFVCEVMDESVFTATAMCSHYVWVIY